MRKYALDMQLQEGKRPGYYAQLVKALAGAPLYDRDKMTLIAADEPGLEAIAGLLDGYGIGYDELELFELPAAAVTTNRFPDYGFESRSGRRYVLLDTTAGFRVAGLSEDPLSLQAALQQMEEHLIGRFEREDGAVYLTDATLMELMKGIGRAYGCEVTPAEL